MSLMRWDAFRELEEISNRMNAAFGRPQTTWRGGQEKQQLAVPDWSPAVDIAETPEEFVIKAELPDVKREDVKLAVENGILTLEGERKLDKEEKNRKYHRVERFYGSFMRTFSLPENVDAKHVRAEFKDGVLSVRVPKAEKPKPQAIEIKVG